MPAGEQPEEPLSTPAASRSTLVVGERGAGKSRLIDSLCDGTTRRVACLPLLQAVPAAAISLLVGRRLEPSEPETVSAVSELTGRVSVIEDLQWIDELSFAAILRRMPHQSFVLSLRPEVELDFRRRAQLLAAGCREVRPPAVDVGQLGGLTADLDALLVEQLQCDSGGNPALAAAVAAGREAERAMALSLLSACSPGAVHSLGRLYRLAAPCPIGDVDEAASLVRLGLVRELRTPTGPALELRHGAVGRAALALGSHGRGQSADDRFDADTGWIDLLSAAAAALIGTDRTALDRIAEQLGSSVRTMSPGGPSSAVRRAMVSLERQRFGGPPRTRPVHPEPTAVPAVVAAIFEAELRIETADSGRIDPPGATEGRLADDGPALPIRQWAMAEADLVGGRPKRARARAARLQHDDEVSDAIRSLSLVTMAWAAADTGEIGTIPAPVPAIAETVADAAQCELTAIAAFVAGDHERAAASFERARSSWAGRHHRGALRCTWAVAECLRRAGHGEQALQMLDEVEAEAERLGALPLLAKVRASQRAAGRRRSNRRTQTASGLTRMEQQVLSLMATGDTNRQIGERLGIATSTVDTHVEAILMKLGAQTRVQAVALGSAGTTQWR